jgi:SAM-dependent methyltransferase
MTTQDFHQDNRAAWEITAAKYEQSEAEDTAFLRAGGNALMQPEQNVLGDLSGWCERAIHLQCAAGLETLSLLRQGAKAVTGVDISERMIASARRKTAALGLSASSSGAAEWVCCDVLDAPPSLDASADLVHTGRGALNWMMDLDAWAAVVRRLLKPGGRLHIYEGHPLDWVWQTDAPDYRFDAQRGRYFGQGLYGGEVWPKPFIDYQKEVDPATVQVHDRAWTLGQILNSVIHAGLRIEFFDEYPLPFWNQFPAMPPEMLERLPHSFTLLARKESA